MDKKKQRSVLSCIMEWAGQKRGMYVASILLAAANVIARLLPYYYIGDIINRMIAGDQDAAGYGRDIALILLFFLVAEICHSLSTAEAHKATYEVIRNIRETMVEKLSRMPLGRVQERGSGALKNTIVERLDSIETTMAHLLPEITSNLLAPILIFVFLLRIDVRMAFITLIPIAIGLLPAIALFSGYGESYQHVVDTTKVLNDTAVEYVSGIEVIKAFSKTQGSYQKFVDAAKNNADSYLVWMKRCAYPQAGTLTIIPYTLLGVLPLGALFVHNGSLSLQNFVMCVILSLGLLTPLVTLGSHMDDIAAGETIVNEITDLLDEKEIVRPQTTKEPPHDHSVELRHVTFSYSDGEGPAAAEMTAGSGPESDKTTGSAGGNAVLKDISMRFEPDTVNAIVGPSGSGKSTIAKLIAGFYEVNSGEIDFGGVNAKDISAEDLRRQVAYVSQDNYLFNESVMENIRQGNENASDEEVKKIAKESGCYDFIMSLENGFDTVVGSSGGHLSGGERQRISIARAMLKNAPVIILDEATAYTDPENEAIVEQAIAKLVKGKTLIIIAHRLYTIQTARRIFLINDGRLEAAGTQEELLEKSALYRRMWQSHMASRDNEEDTPGAGQSAISIGREDDHVASINRNGKAGSFDKENVNGRRQQARTADSKVNRPAAGEQVSPVRITGSSAADTRRADNAGKEGATC